MAYAIIIAILVVWIVVYHLWCKSMEKAQSEGYQSGIEHVAGNINSFGYWFNGHDERLARIFHDYAKRLRENGMPPTDFMAMREDYLKDKSK